jgi:hypothetical protein
MIGSPDWTWWVLGAVLGVIMLIPVWTRVAPDSATRSWARIRYQRRPRSFESATTEASRGLEP